MSPVCECKYHLLYFFVVYGCLFFCALKPFCIPVCSISCPCCSACLPARPPACPPACPSACASASQLGEALKDFFRRTLNFWQLTAYERTQHVGKASKDARAALAAGTAGLQIVPDSSSLQLAASIHCRVWNACSWTSLLEPCPVSLYPVSDSSLVFPPSLTPIALPAFPQELRRDGFDLCEERYLQLQPVLVEVGGWLAAGCWLGGCACGCALQADGRSGTHLS